MLYRGKNMGLNNNGGKEKRGILIVSFGTSIREVEERCIRPVIDAVKARFSDYHVEEAITSEIIRRKLASGGRTVYNPAEMVRIMADNGFTHLIVQPLLFMKGHEFDKKISKPLHALEDLFEEFIIGDPVLSADDDFRLMAWIIRQTTAVAGDETVILMGHGTDHSSNSVYCKLQRELNRTHENIYIATVEGSPVLDDILETLVKKSIKRVHLFPLMLVAGDHARNDMAGDDEESWVNILRRSGIEAIPHLIGMGESVLLHNLVLGHIEKCLV